MKIIGFSVLEVLSSLLTKKKVQTIRPAWKDVVDKDFPIITMEEKPPRFKAGDQAKIVWKPRTKKQLFCPGCGKVFNKDGEHPFCDVNAKYWNEASLRSKDLGITEITEVFQVEMSKSKELAERSGSPITYDKFWVTDKKHGVWAKSNVEELARLDGFKSAEEMFELFDNMYNLSMPKLFHVYRFAWVGES